MTREDVLALPAGPELDELVATKVLGLEKRPVGRDAERYGATVYGWFRGDLGPLGYTEPYMFAEAWLPSKSIHDCWRLVEWAWGQGYALTLYGDEGGWTADLRRLEGCSVKQYYCSVAPTPEVALCRTVLTAALGLEA